VVVVQFCHKTLAIALSVLRSTPPAPCWLKPAWRYRASSCQALAASPWLAGLGGHDPEHRHGPGRSSRRHQFRIMWQCLGGAELCDH
jgi:hypothetical protein